MKKLLAIVAICCAANFAQAQDLVTNTSDAPSTAAVPYAVEVSEHYTIISGYKVAVAQAPNAVLPNYAKLAVLPISGSTLQFSSSFEGAIKLQYIITNGQGEVLGVKEINVRKGPQLNNIDMSTLAAGEYFITANVASKETKATSTYSFKLLKK
jgi:hypothetical protein